MLLEKKNYGNEIESINNYVVWMVTLLIRHLLSWSGIFTAWPESHSKNKTKTNTFKFDGIW